MFHSGEVEAGLALQLMFVSKHLLSCEHELQGLWDRLLADLLVHVDSVRPGGAQVMLCRAGDYAPSCTVTGLLASASILR